MPLTAAVDTPFMATADGSQALRSTPSAAHQVVRGIGWSVAGLATLLLVTMVLKNPGAKDGITNTDTDTGHTTVNIEPQWKAMLVVAVVAGSAFFVFRRLRRWSERPRWLLPFSVVVLVASAALMLMPLTVTDGYSDSHTCSALLDAWHPIVANPGAADLAVRSSLYNVKLEHSPFHDAARERAFYAAQRTRIEARGRAITATPAYQRAERYVEWTTSQNACAPRARTLFAASSAVLLGGAAGLSGATALSRKRRVNTD